MQLCRWAKWSGSAQREARDVCEERRGEESRDQSWPWHMIWERWQELGQAFTMVPSHARARGHAALGQLERARRAQRGKNTLPIADTGLGSRAPLTPKQSRGQGRVEFNHKPACGTQHSQAALPNLASTPFHPIPHSSSSPPAISEIQQVIKNHQE